MSAPTPLVVHGDGGLHGTIEPGERGEERVTIRLDGGRQIVVPAGLLTERGDGSYDLPFGAAEIGEAAEAIVPVVVEEVDVQKRKVDAGRVRVKKVVREHEQLVDVPLLREDVDVERVTVDRFADGPVEVRQEGDTLIVPLVEEVLVVEKRLLVREELRITRRRVEEHRPQKVTVRREEATVGRLGPGAAGEGTSVQDAHTSARDSR
jgi:uncharacterized protein (TIGR02271 family)